MKKFIFAFFVTVLLLGAFFVLKHTSPRDNFEYKWTEEDEIAVRDLVREADIVYNKVAGTGLNKSDALLLVDGVGYYAVTEHFVKSMEALYEYIDEVYVDGEELFSDIINGKDGVTPRYIEKDGKLYSIRDSIPLKSLENIKSIEILKNEEADGIIKLFARVDYYYRTEIVEVWKEGEIYRIKSRESEKTTLSEKHIVSEDDGKLTLDTTPLSVSKKFSDEELKAIFLPLFERGTTVHELLNNSTAWANIAVGVKLSRGSYSYFAVDCPEVASIDDLWALAKSAFTADASERLFQNALSDTYFIARYIEEDGKLYCRVEGHGRSADYDFNTFEVAAQYKDAAVVSVDDRDGITYYFVMQNGAEGWRLDNFEADIYDFVLERWEITSVVNDVLSRASEVWQRLVLCDFDVSEDFYLNGQLYHKITDTDFQSLQDIKDYFHSAFHYSSFDLLLLQPLISPESGVAKYIEMKGGLWCLAPSMPEGALTLDVTEVVIHKNKLDHLYVTAKTLIDSVKVEIKKLDGEWILYRAYAEEYDVAISNTRIISTNDRGISYNTNDLRDSDELDTTEAISVFTPLITRLGLINDILYSPTLGEGRRVESAFITDDKSVLRIAATVYAEEAITRLIYPLVKGETSAYYKNEEGVYCFRESRAEKRNIEYLFDTLEIVEQKEKFLMVKLDRTVDGELEKNIVFSMYKTADGWRLLNGEDEKYSDLVFYEKYYLKGYSRDTIFAEITLPEVSLDEMTYVPNEITDTADFDFGECVPFVSYDVEQYSRHSNAYRLAFLNENVQSLDEGYELWKKLNDKYLITYPYVKLGKLEENSTISDFLFGSKITYVSPLGDTLGRMRYICEGLGDGGDIYYAGADWRAEYDIIENGEVVKTVNSDDYWYYHDILSDWTPQRFVEAEMKYEYVPSLENNGGSAFLFEGDKNRIAFAYEENGTLTYRIYSLDSGHVLCEFKLPNTPEDNAYCTSLVSDRWLVICRNVTLFAGDNGGHAYHNYQAVYIYDFNTGELSLAEDYAEDPRLSPDGRLLLYFAPVWDSSYDILSGWDKADIGIYIKNLETGKTVFYPQERIDETTYHTNRVDFISWVKRDAFEELIK